MNKNQAAKKDVLDAVKKWPIWTYMAMLEMRQRYRRSAIGPWWITISMAVFIGAMSIIYGRLFHQDMATYVPFFTVGFLFWTLMASCVSDAVEAFKQSSGYIKQMKLPYCFYLFKHVYRQCLFLMHNMVVYVIVVLYFHLPIWHWSLLLFIPGFFLVLVNLIWVTLLIGLLGIRFRDIVQVVSSCVQIAFFISPVTWMPKLVGENSLIVKLNPVSYLLEVVRQPLLGHAPAMTTWLAVIVLAMIGSTLTFFVFARYRARIPFWVD